MPSEAANLRAVISQECRQIKLLNASLEALIKLPSHLDKLLAQPESKDLHKHIRELHTTCARLSQRMHLYYLQHKAQNTADQPANPPPHDARKMASIACITHQGGSI